MGWSLRESDRRSADRFTEQAIGSYERGDRAVKAAKVLELADLYGANPIDLITGVDPPPPATTHFVLNLPAVADLPDTKQPLQSFVRQITTVRGDYAGKVLRIRRTDVQMLAGMYGCSAAEVGARLDALGVLKTNLNPRL